MNKEEIEKLIDYLEICSKGNEIDFEPVPPEDTEEFQAAAALRHLLSVNERLREALTFYAEPKSWEADGHPQIDADTVPVTRDGGRRARAALEAA